MVAGGYYTDALMTLRTAAILRDRRWVALLLFLVALGIRAVVISVVVSTYDADESAVMPGGLHGVHGIVKNDAVNYYMYGARIIQEVHDGRSFFLAGGGGRYEWTFLYPRLIALYGLATGGIRLHPDGTVPTGQVYGLLMAQSVVYSLAVAAMFLALTTVVPYAVACGAGVFLAIEPTLLQYAALVYSETFFVAFLLFAFACWLIAIRRIERGLSGAPFLIAAGVAFGAAFLQRPVALLLPVVAVAVLPLSAPLWCRRRLIRCAVQLLGPFLLIVGLLALHNLWRAGFAYIMPQQSLYVPQAYVASDVVARVRGISVEQARRDLLRATIDRAKAAGVVPRDDPARGLLTGGSDPDWSERQWYEFNRMRQQSAVETFLTYPSETVRLLVRRTAASVNVDPFFTFRLLRTSLRSPAAGAQREFEALRERVAPFRLAYSALILAPAVVGILSAWRMQRPLTALLVGLVAYLVGMTGYMGNGRYLVPALISYSVFWTLAVRDGFSWLRRVASHTRGYPATTSS